MEGIPATDAAMFRTFSAARNRGISQANLTSIFDFHQRESVILERGRGED